MSSAVPEDAAVAQNGVDVKEFFGKLQPFIEKLMDVYSQAAPYIHTGIIKVKQVYDEFIGPKIKEYYLNEFSNVILGIVLLFFGGSFAMTIACYSALQISGTSLSLFLLNFFLTRDH